MQSSIKTRLIKLEQSKAIKPQMPQLDFNLLPPEELEILFEITRNYPRDVEMPEEIDKEFMRLCEKCFLLTQDSLQMVE